jgi:hypothetical protein
MSRKCREISRPPRSCEQDFRIYPFPVPPLIYDASGKCKDARSHEEPVCCLATLAASQILRTVTSLLRTSAMSGRHVGGSLAAICIPNRLAVDQVDKMRAIGSTHTVSCHSKFSQNFKFTAIPSPLAVLAFSLQVEGQ